MTAAPSQPGSSSSPSGVIGPGARGNATGAGRAGTFSSVQAQPENARNATSACLIMLRPPRIAPPADSSDTSEAATDAQSADFGHYSWNGRPRLSVSHQTSEVDETPLDSRRPGMAAADAN